MEATLSLTGAQHERLRAHLFPGDGREAVAILLCGRHAGTDRTRLLARSVHPVPHDACIERRPDRVRWPTDVLLPWLQAASKEGLSVVKVHSHPGGWARFSGCDDAADAALFPCVSGWFDDDLPHASVLMLPGGEMLGRTVDDRGRFGRLSRVTVVGDDLHIWNHVGDLSGGGLPEFMRRHGDLPEMFAVRGIEFCHETVREWEAKLTPALAEDLRRRRGGKAGRSCHVDETYIKVGGRWCYVYRAIDGSGALVDVVFSDKRDMAAARAFFRSAKATTGITPDRVTSDGHASYPRAIRTELGRGVRHRTGVHRNNRLEQDHRGLKGRSRPMRGFECPGSAARFCRAYDEPRNFLRPRPRYNQHVPADRHRSLFLGRAATVLAILEAA